MSDATRIEVKGGRIRTVLSVSAVTLLTFLTGYAALYSDRHNDERYISKEEYRKDRENDEKLRASVQALITQRADQTDKKLDDLSGDVKALLRRTSISFETNTRKLTP